MSAAQREAYVFPMAFAQQRLWFLEQLQPGSSLYHLSYVLSARGALSRQALERAVNDVIARHESLRTTFGMVDDRPVQLVASELALAVPVHEVMGASAEARRQQALAAARQRCLAPFDLSRGPLLRVELFRLAEDEHLLVVAMHHIVSDGWSLAIFVQELAELYAAHLGGRRAELTELPIQYADYASWQHQHLTGATQQEQLAFWREQLEGAPALLELPTDQPRPAAQRFRGSVVELEVAAPLAERLRRLCLQTKTTPFMLLLGVFAAVLARHARQPEVVIGTPIANRNRAETAGLIGFFVNTLALRIRLEDDPSLLVLLDRVRQLSMAAHAHQDLPFEQVVNALSPERTLGHAPIFQVMFAYQNVPSRALAAEGLELAPVPFDDGSAKFDLTLFVEEGESALVGRLEYDLDLFERGTIERLRDHFLALLEQALDFPTRPLALLPLLLGQERQRVLIDCNRTAAEVPRASTMVQMFEEQAARTPEAAAVRWRGEALSYSELEARANQLAHALRARGVGRGVIVGVCAPRRPETIIGLLAVLKAGGAYLPLDPNYPLERLRFMASDAGLRHLLHLGQGAALAGLPAEVAAGSFELRDDWREAAAQARSPLADGASAEDLAYLIYTSGSTGQPKGVYIAHRGLVNYLHWARRAYEVSAGGAVPMASSLSFDATITALWLPLVAGACVELVPEEDELEALAALLTGPRPYELLKITPSHLEALAALVPATGPLAVRALVIGGEALWPQQLAFWQRAGTRAINEYGPTETVVGCAVYPVRGELAAGRGVPIGRAIANTQLYVLDDKGQPVPMGVPGELYIGGDGVGLGYHGRAELTAQRFIELARLPALAEALAGCGGQVDGTRRLYRSGDLVRLLADGNLEYLGRLDEQVKLRGFRIELGEIEAALVRAKGVSAAAVALHQEPSGRKVLVGYVVPASSEATVAGEALAAFLRQCLPDHMVPSGFVTLAALPLTGNGKLDRRALPAPVLGEGAGPGGEPPRQGVEAVLAEIWQRVLAKPMVSRSSNFFALGGDSISAMQVVSRARAAGLHVTPRMLFQHQTLAALAKVVSQAVERDKGAAQEPPDGAVALTPIQRWFSELALARPHHFNQSVLVQVDPALTAEALGAGLDRLVRAHAALRLAWQRREGLWQQQLQPASSVPLEVIELSAAEPWQAATARVDARMQASLELERAPLLRAALLRRGDQARLLLLAHHVIVDGVSWRVLLEDLAAALTGGEPAPASAPFWQWAQHLEAKVAALGDAGQPVAHWRERLREVPPLPCDGAGPNLVAEAAQLVRTLDREATADLVQGLTARARASVEEILLTALALALRAFTGSSSAVIELESHGRFAEDALDLSRSVGFFTSLYPLRLELPAGEDSAAALRAIKEQARQVTDGGVSYGLLRYLHPDEQVRAALVPAAPVPVLFNYLGQLDGAAALGPLRGLCLEYVGATRAAENQRTHLIELNAYLAEGQLVMSWEYGSRLHQRASIDRLADEAIRALQRLRGAAEQSQEALSPTDFPAARVQAKDLTSLLARLKKKGG